MADKSTTEGSGSNYIHQPEEDMKKRLGISPGTNPTPQIPQASKVLDAGPWSFDTGQQAGVGPGLVETTGVTAKDPATEELGFLHTPESYTRQSQPLSAEGAYPEPPSPFGLNPQATEVMNEVLPGVDVLPPPAQNPSEASPLPPGYVGTAANIQYLEGLKSAVDRVAASEAWRHRVLASWLLRRQMPSPDIEGYGEMTIPYADPLMFPGSAPPDLPNPDVPRELTVRYVRLKGESDEEAQQATRLLAIEMSKKRHLLQAGSYLEGAALNLPRVDPQYRDDQARWQKYGLNWDEGQAETLRTAGMAQDLVAGLAGARAGMTLSTSDAVFMPVANLVSRGLRPGAVKSILSPVAKKLGWNTLDKLALSPTLKESTNAIKKLLWQTGGWVDNAGVVHVPVEALESAAGAELRARLVGFGDEIRKLDPTFTTKLNAIAPPMTSLEKAQKLGEGMVRAIAGGSAIQAAQILPELAGSSSEERQQVYANVPEMIEEGGVRLPILMELAQTALGAGGHRLGVAMNRPRHIAAEATNKAIKEMFQQRGVKEVEVPLLTRQAYLGEPHDIRATMQREIFADTPDPTNLEPSVPASQLKLTHFPLDPDLIPSSEVRTQIEDNLAYLANVARVGHEVQGSPIPTEGLRQANTAIMNFDKVEGDYLRAGLAPTEAKSAASLKLLETTQQFADQYREIYKDDNALPASPDPARVKIEDLGDESPYVRALAIDQAASGEIALAGWLHNSRPEHSDPAIESILPDPPDASIPIWIVDGRLVANMTDGNITLKPAPKPEELPNLNLVDVSDTLMGLALPDHGEAFFENSATSPIHIDLVRDRETSRASLRIDADKSMSRDLQQRALRRLADPDSPLPDEPADILWDMNNISMPTEENRVKYADRIYAVRKKLEESRKGLDDLARSYLPPEAEPDEIAEKAAMLDRTLNIQEIMLAEAERRAGIFDARDIDGQAIMEARKAVEAAEVPEGLVRVYRLEGSEGPPVFTTDLHGTLMRSLTEGRDIETLDVLPAAVRDGRFEAQPGQDLPSRKIPTIAYRDRALHEDFALPEGLDPNTIKSDLDPSTRDRLGLGGNTLPAARVRLWLKKGTAALESELAAKKDLAGILPALEKFPEEDRIPVQAFLNELVETGYFRGLKVRTPDIIPTDKAVGRSYPRANIIEVYLDSISKVTKLLRGQPHAEMYRPATTLIHELWHALSYHLPEKEIADFRKLYDRALVKLGEETGLPPDMIEGQKWRGSIDPDLATEIQLIAHSTLDEFFVYQMVDRTYSHLNNVISNPVVARAKILWNALLGFIHRVVGRDKAQQVFNNFLSGYYTPLTMEQKAARGWTLANSSVFNALTPAGLSPRAEALTFLGTNKMRTKHFDILDEPSRIRHIAQRFWRQGEFQPGFPVPEAGSKSAERMLGWFIANEPKLRPDGTYDRGGMKEITQDWSPAPTDFQKIHKSWEMAQRRLQKRIDTLERLSKGALELTRTQLAQAAQLLAYHDPAELTPDQFNNAVQTVIMKDVAQTRGEDYFSEHPVAWHQAREAFYTSFERLVKSGEIDKLPPHLKDPIITIIQRIPRLESAYADRIWKDNLEANDIAAHAPENWKWAVRLWIRAWDTAHTVQQTAKTLVRRYTRPTADSILSLEMSDPDAARDAIRSGKLAQDPAMLYTQAAGDFKSWIIGLRNDLYPIINFLRKQPRHIGTMLFDALDVGKGPATFQLQNYQDITLPDTIAKTIGKPHGANLGDLALWFREDFFPQLWRETEGPLIDKYMEHAVSARTTMAWIFGNLGRTADRVPKFKTAINEAMLEFFDNHPDYQRYPDLDHLNPKDETTLRALFGDKKFKTALRAAKSNLADLADGYLSAARMYDEATKKAEDLKAGRGRKENYAPHVFFKTHLLPVLREMFESDLYSYAAFLPKDLYNQFLKDRSKLGEDYTHDLAAALMVYIPVMGRTIHLEPAMRKVLPLLDQIPNDALRQKYRDLGKKLLGQQDIVDRYFAAAHNSTVEHAATVMSLPIRNDMRLHPQEFQKGSPLSITQRIFNGMLFMQMVGAWDLAKLNVMEHMLVPLAMANSPTKFAAAVFKHWPKGLWQGSKMLLKDAALGNHLVGEYVRKMFHQDPYVSEPSAMGVVAPHSDLAIREARKIIGERTGQYGGPTLADAMNNIWSMWYWQQVAIDAHERRVSYSTYKSEGLAHGMTESEARLYAKLNTERLFSDYSRAGQSPYTLGGFGHSIFFLKRFMLNRGDDVLLNLATWFKSKAHARRIQLGIEPQPGAPPKPLVNETVQTMRRAAKNLGRSVTLPPPENAGQLPRPGWFTPEELDIMSRTSQPIAETWYGKYPSPSAIAAGKWRAFFLATVGLPAFWKFAEGVGRQFSTTLPWYLSLSAPVLNYFTDLAMYFDPTGWLQRKIDEGDQNPDAEFRRRQHETIGERLWLFPGQYNVIRYNRRLMAMNLRRFANAALARQATKHTMETQYPYIWFQANINPWGMPPELPPQTSIPNLDQQLRMAEEGE